MFIINKGKIFWLIFFTLFGIESFSRAIYSNPDSVIHEFDKPYSGVDDFLDLVRSSDYLRCLTFLGNSYSPSLLDFHTKNADNFLGLNQFSRYKGFEDKRLYFNKSNSEIIFKSASKKNIEFEINHIQRLGKQVLFDVDFLTARSLGFYSNQQTNFKKVKIGLEVKSKNERYVLTANYFNFKFSNDESGGIGSDSVFINEVKSNTQLYTTNLTSSNSVVIDKNWLIKNEYYLLRKNLFHDSLFSTPLAELFLKSEFRYNRHSFLFNSDAKEDYFENNFYDTTKSKDTLWSKNYSHNLSLNFISSGGSNSFFQNIMASVYSQNNAVKSGHFNFDSTFNASRYGLRAGCSPMVLDFNVGVHAFFGSISKRSEFYPYSVYVFADYKFKNNFDFKLSFESENCIPTLIENSYYSNHFIWKNNFDSYNVSRYSLRLNSAKFKSSVETSLEGYKNFIYFDIDAQPKQHRANVNVLKVALTSKLHAGKFYFENAVVYRNSSDENIFRVPQLSTLSNWYYSNKVFKNNLEIQPGISLRYFTSFYSNAYQPATGQFYLQNDVKIGNYPYFDVYLNMNLKRATLLLMVEHVNAGFGGRNYFVAPHYPSAGRTIKFMLRWNLVN